MTSKIHELVNGISEADLGLLVKVAFEGINDCDAMREIAGIVDMAPEDLLAFGDRVVDPLLTPAEIAMGWYTQEAVMAGDGRAYLLGAAEREPSATNEGGEAQIVQVNIGQNQRNSGADAAGMLQINIGANQRNAGRNHFSDGDFHE